MTVTRTSTAFAAYLSPNGKRIVPLMPAETAEGQKAQSQVIFLENFLTKCGARFHLASNCIRV
jgi:hypothetical protein